jgi:hypothetical protein
MRDTQASKLPQPSYIESLANELLAKYRRLDTVLSHAPSKGNYHEQLLRNVIRGYLPSTFSTGEGFIINEEGKTSTQLDVLIVDNLDPRSFGYKERDFFIASDLAVTCFGEVKTYCTKKEFITSFHNLVNNKLLLCTPEARVTSFMFCYDAYASKDTFAKWVDMAIGSLPNRSSAKQWHYPDYVFCLKKNVMLERRSASDGFQYWSATSKGSTNIIQQKIMQDLFQCITDGCGRVRKLQGIKLLKD